eukprot:gene15098-biopygen12631
MRDGRTSRKSQVGDDATAARRQRKASPRHAGGWAPRVERPATASGKDAAFCPAPFPARRGGRKACGDPPRSRGVCRSRRLSGSRCLFVGQPQSVASASVGYPSPMLHIRVARTARSRWLGRADPTDLPVFLLARIESDRVGPFGHFERWILGTARANSDPDMNRQSQTQIVKSCARALI